MPFKDLSKQKEWAREKRRRYAALGLCERCAQPRAEGYALCAWHHQWKLERVRIASWNRLRAAGVPTRYKDGRTYKPHSLSLTGLFPAKAERMKRWAAARAQRKLQRKVIEPVTSYYPFLSRPTYQEDELMLQVDAAVPRHLPQQIRADVCQELVLGILTGEVKREDLSSAVREYIKVIYRTYERPRHFVSIDQPISHGNDRTYADILSA